jgi:L-lactate dehydrogenase complex protein LldE
VPPPASPTGPTIALFVTCLTDQFYPRAGTAVVLVLEALGYTIAFPEAQTCCGQPMYNTGRHDDARTLAARMIEIFEPYTHVVTPSASCAAMVREHALHLFHDQPELATKAKALADKTYEFAEFISKVVGQQRLALTLTAPLPSPQHAARRTQHVTVHTSCHQRSLGPSTTPQILAQVPGLEVRPLAHAEQCCGFGGAFAVKHPEISGPMVEEKVRDIAATGAQTLVCNDAGCAMNIDGACQRMKTGHQRTRHLAEILAESMGLLPHEPRA